MAKENELKKKKFNSIEVKRQLAGEFLRKAKEERF